MDIEAVKTFKHKELTINIFRDDDCQSPDEMSGKDKDLFLVHYHRDFEIRRDDIVLKDNMVAWYSGKKIEAEKQYHIFLTKAYIHSGIVLALEDSGRMFPDEQWDVNRCGCVLVSKKTARTKKKAMELASRLIETWNDYLNGNVYGYMINGEGGCWGFYGDFETSGIIAEAKAEAEGMAKEKITKHIRKVKAQIKNGVALDKRQAILFC